MNAILRWLSSIAACCLALAVPSGAQTRVVEAHDASVAREQAARCAVAIEILATGRSSSYHAVTSMPDSVRDAWAHGAVSHCGADGERALAAAITRASQSTNRTELRSLTSSTRELHGPAVFTAAQAIAGDRSASAEARVFALRSLTWAIRPELLIEYDNYAGAPGATCTRAVGLVLDTARDTSAETVRSVVDLAKRLTSDSATPASVRNAAVCTRTNLWRLDLRLPAATSVNGIGPACRPADAKLSLEVRVTSQFVTSTDSDHVRARQFEQLPAVADTSVQAVTTDSICAAARASYNAALPLVDRRPDRTVYVIRVGDRYVVEDPLERVGEFVLMMVMDRSFVVLGKFAQ